ncbi:MAG TPA: DUF4340 domain-containing protein [Burkholderiales bacterium]|nr:DUF4340 domain-containing protein [Burkholderiales bacterium]
MSARLALIFVILLVVLGGGALLYQQQERSRRPDNVGTLGQPLLKDLKASEIKSIRITEPKSKLTLNLKNDTWVIAERDDFPADFVKVRDFVVKAISLKVGQSEPIGDKDRARLNLDESGTQVEFMGGDGKPIGKLTVGKKYFKRDVDNPEKANADGRFVAVPGEPKQAYLVSDALAQASTRTADWIDRQSFQVEKVKTLEVRHPDGGTWRIERDGDNADWRMAPLRPGEKVEPTKANAASYSLSLLELADVAPKGSTIENPIQIEATTLDGLSYSIKVGKAEGENHPVAFSSSGNLTPGGDSKDAERLKKIEARLPREKVLQQHVLLIPKAKLEDTLKKREDLLVEKKQDAKK